MPAIKNTTKTANTNTTKGAMQPIARQRLIESVVVSAQIEGIHVTAEEIEAGLKKYKKVLAANSKKAKARFQ